MSKGQYIGYCRYCKQQTMLQIDDVVAADYENNPEEWEAYLEEEATKKCKCQGASAWWNVERRVRNAEDRCLELATNEEIGNILQSSVRPLMKGKLDKVTIKYSGVNYNLFLDGNERIHIRREHKVTEEKTE